MNTGELTRLLLERARGAPRFMVAIAGPPGSGKSTLAAQLVQALQATGQAAVAVPMDGFHFDDIVLNARGTRNRKGAPWTFDAAGFLHLIKRIRACEPDVAIPVFDRTVELSRNAADIVNGTDKFIIVEGNYLLLKEPVWCDLKPLFDLTIFLDVPLDVVQQRLLARIKQHGHDEAFALHWMQSNDMPNAKIVQESSAAADVVLKDG